MANTPSAASAPGGARFERITHRSVCRICVAGCGVEVDVAGDQVVGVRGDRDHPLSHGYLCPKGRGYPLRHHSADRLTFPTIRGERVSWEECLDDLAGELGEVIDGGGPDRLGCYIGTGAFTDTTGRWSVQSLLRALGSRQIYSAATVDIAPVYRAAELVTGFHTVFPAWDPGDADQPRVAILFGFNPVVSHGYANVPSFTDPVRRLRSFRERGGRVWAVDPRRTETAAHSDRHLTPRPGTDAALLAWLVRELLDDGADRDELAAACRVEDVDAVRAAVAPFDLRTVAGLCDVPATDLEELLAEIRAAGQVAIAAGTGIAFSEHALVASWLQWVLLIITGSVDRPGGMRFTPSVSDDALAHPAPPGGSLEAGPASRPDLSGVLGERPAAALADEILAGDLRALIVTGGNPLTALPGPDRVRAALRQLDLCVVVDSFENEMTELATHVLPASWHFERADLLLFSRPMFSPAIVPATGEARPTWWMFGQLGLRLGHRLLGPELSLDDVGDEAVFTQVFAGRLDVAPLVAAGPHGVDQAQPVGWVHQKVLPGGRWRLAPPVALERLPRVLESTGSGLRLASGRRAHNNNSVLYGVGPQAPVGAPPIAMSVADAAAAQLVEGDWATVTSASGTVSGPVHIDERLREGAIHVTHGYTVQNVGHLIDFAALDAFTGQPAQTGVAVTVRSFER